MTIFEGAPHAPPTDPGRLIAAVGLTLLACQLYFLTDAYIHGVFLIDGAGQWVHNDFVSFWAAGRLTLDGQAAAVYDWIAHHRMQETAIGHAFPGVYRWHYPPPYLFAAALTATLPLVPAGVAWLLATGTAYATVIRGIIGRRAGWLFALGFPNVMWNVAAGQNGFLTAALTGGTLALLQRRPALAGCCLGALTYKPHLGVLFPLVLVASGSWITIATASAVALGTAALSWLAFGSAPWQALFDSVAAANQLVLNEGGAGWYKLQSLFGFVRTLGGGAELAWALQGALAAIVAVALVLLWRGRAPFELKAAALSVGIVLVTPYVYAYDMVVLAVPAAFLLRFALAHGFLRLEALGFGVAGILLLVYGPSAGQSGLAASLILAFLIARRVIDWARLPSDVPPTAVVAPVAR
jgi:hypothetical protein